MNVIKVEGSIDPLPEMPFQEHKPEIGDACFTQLMFRMPPPAANRLSRQARYRISGGQLDGVELVVSEHGQTIWLRVNVDRPVLYRTLKALKGWLEHQLQCPDYALSLEIHYVASGA